MLAVTANLRIIDVEIKISRADLKADARKEKWFHNWDFWVDGPYDKNRRKPRQWPQKIWKHYYCLPAEIWDSSLLECLPSVSGILLMYPGKANGELRLRVERMARPNSQADRLSPEDAVDIARLASLRMWDAHQKIEKSETRTK